MAKQTPRRSACSAKYGKGQAVIIKLLYYKDKVEVMKNAKTLPAFT